MDISTLNRVFLRHVTITAPSVAAQNPDSPLHAICDLLEQHLQSPPLATTNRWMVGEHPIYPRIFRKQYQYLLYH